MIILLINTHFWRHTTHSMDGRDINVFICIIYHIDFIILHFFFNIYGYFFQNPKKF